MIWHRKEVISIKTFPYIIHFQLNNSCIRPQFLKRLQTKKRRLPTTCLTSMLYFSLPLLKRFILTTCVCIRYIEITLIISIKTCKEITQLASTSNKRSSSGEMKIYLKRVGLYKGDGLDTLEDQRWTVRFNIHISHGGCLINDQPHVWVWGDCYN